MSDDPSEARAVLDLLPSVPTPVWGRDELDAGEMWNSNSVVAWVLSRAGVDATKMHPPAGGRAPGWHAVRVGDSGSARDPSAGAGIAWRRRHGGVR